MTITVIDNPSATQRGVSLAIIRDAFSAGTRFPYIKNVVKNGSGALKVAIANAGQIGSATGDRGTITANWFGNILATNAFSSNDSGSIYANFAATGRPNDADASGARFEAIGGSFLGNISVVGGSINRIEALSGTIGDPTTPSSITTSGPLSSGITASIETITAKSIWASISAPNTASPRGDVFSLTTTGTGPGEGDFTGSLSCFSIGASTGNAMMLSGSLNATVDLGGTVKRPVSIAGSVESVASLSTGANQDLADGGDITVVGNLNGSITVGDDKFGNITVNGVTNGLIYIAGSIASPAVMNLAGGVSTSGLVKIDRSLDSGRTISVGGTGLSGRILIGDNLAGTIALSASGLKGQIVVNADSNGSTWTGHVTVGGSPLSPKPSYAQTPSSVGGGAAGLAPFHLHDEGCTPPNGQTGAGQGIPAGEFFVSGAIPVKVRHYGPIKLNVDGGYTSWSTAIIVEGWNNTAGQWGATDLTGLFSVIQVDTRSFGLAKPPTANPKGGLFRIRLKPEAVLSANVNEAGGVVPVVWDTLSAADGLPSYEFRILPDCDLDGVPDSSDDDFVLCPVNPCSANYHHDDRITVEDLFDFLAVYFAGNPCADYNHLDGVDVQDIFDFLAAWFAADSGTRCDPASGPQC